MGPGGLGVHGKGVNLDNGVGVKINQFDTPPLHWAHPEQAVVLA